MEHWFEIKNTSQILSPALLFYPDRIQSNIKKMIEIAGSPQRLRPHIKTHKCRKIIELQLNSGITKFKCATMAEAELLATSGAKDILIAYPLVGPNQVKFIQLKKEYPSIQFSILTDNKEHITGWENLAQESIPIFIDLDVGMGRTGIKPSNAHSLINQLPEILFLKGFHIYDGHIHDSNIDEREKSVNNAYLEVDKMLSKIESTTPLELICGGSISFPIHAKQNNRTLSPGTTVLWDYGYASNFPDLDFKIAAVLLTRVISVLEHGVVCLDIGHKAIASEMKNNPIYFPQFPNAEIVVLSEEHMVIKTNTTYSLAIGAAVYGFPWHICPTVALHEKAAIIEKQNLSDFWNIDGRKRIYSL